MNYYQHFVHNDAVIDNSDDVVNGLNYYFPSVAGKLAGKIPDSVTSEDKNGDFGKNNPNSIFPIREIVHK